jgi:phosphoribosylformylglycinamidine synthase
MRVRVDISRRPEIADPEGATIRRALVDLGFDEVETVRVDRVMHLEISGDDAAGASARVGEMCRQVLTNPVLEDFEVIIEQ